MGNNMTQIQRSKQKIKSCILPSTQFKLQKIPNLKANFTYFKPLSYQQSQQQIPQDQTIIINDHKIKQTIKNTQILQTIQSSRIIQTSQLFQSQTFFNISLIQQIKVKWNSFIKIKQKNYLQEYQFVKKMGQGGFGIVNKVRNIYTQVFRAAKIIKKHSLKQQQHKKLLQQLNIMKSLDHPNIIKLYQIYDYRQQYILILELSQGGQLYQRIKKKKISQGTIKCFMTQIIKTLIYLHSQRVVHRDIKPQNMLFETKGSNTIKLIDFGLTTILQQKQNLNEQIYLSERVGTLSYIAPEVIYRKYNQKCDIWSAGVIFYLMITGMMPFRGENDKELIQNILHKQASFSNTGWSNYSIQCVQLIKLMLNKKSQLRPSASEVFQHKWFKIDNKISSTKILDQDKKIQILNNIRRFSFHNKLQAIINTYIASQLVSSSQKIILNQLFSQIDINHDGIISVQQLKIALSQVKQISYERVQCLKNIIDTNNNGQIQYTQFLVASINHQDFINKKYFQQAFAYFDINHNGTITYQEIIEYLPHQQSQSEIRKMFKQIDVNSNGQIDLQQFIRLFLNDTAQLIKFFPNHNQHKQKQIKDNIIENKQQIISQINHSEISKSQKSLKSHIVKSQKMEINKNKNSLNKQSKYLLQNHQQSIKQNNIKQSKINQGPLVQEDNYLNQKEHIKK